MGWIDNADAEVVGGIYSAICARPRCNCKQTPSINVCIHARHMRVDIRFSTSTNRMV